MRISDWSSDVCSSDLGGWTTRRIAERTGNTGLALGLDISPELVAAATDRAQRAGLANIRFEQGDAATAMPEEAPFDRLHSRFGTMFFQIGRASCRERVCTYV